MPSAGKPVWTAARKLQGNLVPLVVGLAVGVLVWLITARRGGPKPEIPVAALAPAIAGFVISAWASLNWFGLAGNAAMRRELGRRLSAEREGAVEKPWFVGFARPSSMSLLDAHEDVGFLIFHADELEFWGDRLRISVERAAIQRVRFMPSVHTAVWADGWPSRASLRASRSG